MIERGIARDGYKVLDSGGREIGYVTSGSPAPFLKKNIALAYVPPEFGAVGTSVKAILCVVSVSVSSGRYGVSVVRITRAQTPQNGL